MRLVGGSRRFDAEQLERPRRLASRSNQSRKKPEIRIAGALTRREDKSLFYFLQFTRRTRQNHCRASRRNKNAPSTIKRTLGNQTSNSGCACGLPRSVSPMITKRKYVVATIRPMANP